MNKKGFTLIEILTVIIILGILMIIAVPAVSKYILESRETTYVNSIKKFFEVAAAEITASEYSVSNEEYTYYIPTKCLETDNNLDESPYGKFVKSFVVVTYVDGKNDYYYTGFDETGHGVLLTYKDSIKESSIKTGINSIDTKVGIGNREYIYTYSDSCDRSRTKVAATSQIPERGNL